MQNFIYWFQKQAYLRLTGIRKTSKGMIFRLYDDQIFINMQKRKMVKNQNIAKKYGFSTLNHMLISIV